MDRSMQLERNPTVSGWAGTSRHYGAAGLAFIAELIHLWLVPGEFAIAPLRGGFFAVVAACQGMLAASLLFGPGRWALRLGMLINIGLVVVWVMTRFTSLAIFPALVGFTRLPVGALDLTAVAAEIALLALLVQLRRHRVPQNKSG